MSAKMKPGYKQTEVGVIPEEATANKAYIDTLSDGSIRGPSPGRRRQLLFARQLFHDSFFKHKAA